MFRHSEFRETESSLKTKIERLEDLLASKERTFQDEIASFKRKTREAEADMAYHLKERDLELDYKIDSEREALRRDKHALQIEVARLKATNEMLEIAVDISGEVVNIQDLVSQLVAKLPTIDISNITVNAKTAKK